MADKFDGLTFVELEALEWVLTAYDPPYRAFDGYPHIYDAYTDLKKEVSNELYERDRRNWENK